MTTFLIIIHVFICIFLIISILLQSSKGGGLAGVFGGGGGMGGVFGGRGAASFLSKVTMWLGIGFAITAISIALISSRTSFKRKSLLEQVVEKEVVTSPASMLPTIPGEESAPEMEIPPVDTEDKSK
jgi:preprotein translocase subunit SecG